MNLHLKYRPQILTDLVGQPTIQTCLSNAIATGTIAPAYLFKGGRGTGKTSTARIFAKSLNCLNSTIPTVTPCGHCQSCRSITTSSSLDVTEIDAASHGGVDDARELVNTVSLAPVAGRKRVIIIDEAHMLTTQSQNALLKCIEEPPAHVVFILCTTESHKILPTIVSRCLTFEFHRVSVRTIANHIQQIADREQIDLTPDGKSAIALMSRGGLRDALQLLATAALLDESINATHIHELVGTISQSQVLAICEAIASGDVLGLLQIARELIESGKKPVEIHSTLLNFYKDLLIVQQAPKQVHLLTSSVKIDQLRPIALNWSLNTIQSGLRTLQETETQLRYSSNDQAWLEVLLLNLVPQFATPQISKNLGNGQPLEIDPVWQQCLKSASPNLAKVLKKYAKLSSLEDGHATLLVEPAKVELFAKHAEWIERLIQRVTGQPIQLKIKPS
ncbi:MAG: DNA polymerase III subunit gamma/tau [Desertifilum sp. SIO1I2]|nr:DNA polymerase III subunit gamma/tau [Desertifilum sp. SIO1I2]